MRIYQTYPRMLEGLRYCAYDFEAEFLPKVKSWLVYANYTIKLHCRESFSLCLIQGMLC